MILKELYVAGLGASACGLRTIVESFDSPAEEIIDHRKTLANQTAIPTR